MEVVLCEPEFLRSGLLIPQYPLRGFAALLRRHLLGRHGTVFAPAYRATIAAAAAGCLLAVASLILPPLWQRATVIGSAALGVYVILRTLALAVFEQRQRIFQHEWVTSQTEVLRRHTFDIVRFTVQDISSAPYPARSYDLIRLADLRDLLHRQKRERAGQRWIQAKVEFSYLAGRGIWAIAEVKRDLAELTFLHGQAAAGRATVRFPQAYYTGRLGPGPAQRTDWTLSGDVLIAVS